MGNQLQMHPPFQHHQQFAPLTTMPLPFQMGPLNAPQIPFGFQQHNPPTTGVNGPCFVCQQHGHVAKNCPSGQSNPRGGNSRRVLSMEEEILAESFSPKRKMDECVCA